MNQPLKLHERIYNMLRRAQDYTPETADEFKEEQEVLNKVLLAHLDFQEHPPPGHEGFGDMFGSYWERTEQLNAGAGQFFTPMHIVDVMCRITCTPTRGEPQYFSDPTAGCGRFMLGVAKHYHKEVGMYNFLYHNVDIDRRMFVGCTMNAILYGIPSINIWGNTISLEFWEGFAVVQPAGMPTLWYHLDKEAVQQFVPKFTRPKTGLEKFVDVKVAERPERKRRVAEAKPQQSMLGDT